jgi:2,4-dienoyl-CoA reductase-like NADH-dependent reductase (Old Yellow Enzyme family)
MQDVLNVYRIKLQKLFISFGGLIRFAMSILFSPYSIGSITLKNRIVIAPMCQYSAVNGEATDWHLMHLGQLALSGAGMLIIEATAVEPIGRISPADLGLWNDATEQAFARVLKGVREYSNMPIAIQLAHAGRKASCNVPWHGGKAIPFWEGGWQTVAPATVPFNEGDPIPEGLGFDGINRIKQAFAEAAQRAHRLGLDVIEIHAAHGYLLHEFLSPISNLRTDEYGGSLDNRMRMVLEVFSAVKAAVPDTMPVGIRISGTDWLEGGWNIEESIVLTRALKALGCAYIHVSSGGLSPRQEIPLHPNYQVTLAEKIHSKVDIPTIAVGLITEPEQAEAIVAEERADMVALGRAMLYDPRWPWHAAAKLGAQVDAPPQYWRSPPHANKKLFGD